MRSSLQQTPRDEPIDSPCADATALYRFFDTDGRLLYVGITKTTHTRWARHRTHAAWWPLAVTKSVQWIADRSEAERAELTAIRTEGPLWNSAATPSSSARLADARFAQATGGIRTASGEWRNSDMAVQQVLAGEIRQGVLPVGDRLPSVAALTRRFGTSENTVRRAISLLVEDHLVAVEGSGTSRRYVVAAATDDEGWRPPPLPDGRDALNALLEVLRESGVVLAIAANQIGLHLSIVRGWAQRHPHVAAMIEQATAEGRRRRFAKRFGIQRRDCK